MRWASITSRAAGPGPTPGHAIFRVWPNVKSSRRRGSPPSDPPVSRHCGRDDPNLKAIIKAADRRRWPYSEKAGPARGVRSWTTRSGKPGHDPPIAWPFLKTTAGRCLRRRTLLRRIQGFPGLCHRNPDAAAFNAGSDFLVLCDTNGGTLPFEVETITRSAVKKPCRRKADLAVGLKLGIHTHNDCGMAVANTIAAINCGAIMVHGTVNGYGERCGNADLTTIIPVLSAKMGRPAFPRKS
jgi:hypothetical protein